MKLVDADVILRFLLSDNPEKALKCRNLLLSSDEYLHITELALAEVIWVMESSYGVPKEDIASRTLRLVSSPVSISLIANCWSRHWSFIGSTT